MKRLLDPGMDFNWYDFFKKLQLVQISGMKLQSSFFLDLKLLSSSSNFISRKLDVDESDGGFEG